jgi:hypothetical protein
VNDVRKKLYVSDISADGLRICGKEFSEKGKVENEGLYDSD